MATRHQVRVAVVGMLYAVEIGNAATLEKPEPYLEENKIRGKNADWAKTLLRGTLEQKEVLDGLIKEQLKNWEMERLGAIERAILRLGTYEMFHTDTDAPVIINEAVEMAKELADDSSPSFINGILDALRKQKPAKPATSEETEKGES